MIFSHEVDFLGHHISIHSIEPDLKKVKRIINWPVPNHQLKSVLSWACALCSRFPPSTSRPHSGPNAIDPQICRYAFPKWNTTHQQAFNGIKNLVLSTDCLTCIDHDNMGENHIFLTCDSSDWRTGAVLSYGPTWETARPVAFDSMALKAAQLNYPVHEKELLAIIRCDDGSVFGVKQTIYLRLPGPVPGQGVA